MDRRVFVSYGFNKVITVIECVTIQNKGLDIIVRTGDQKIKAQIIQLIIIVDLIALVYLPTADVFQIAKGLVSAGLKEDDISCVSGFLRDIKADGEVRPGV